MAYTEHVSYEFGIVSASSLVVFRIMDEALSMTSGVFLTICYCVPIGFGLHDLRASVFLLRGGGFHTDCLGSVAGFFCLAAS